MTDNLGINSNKIDIIGRQLSNTNINNGANGGCHPMNEWQQVIHKIIR